MLNLLHRWRKGFPSGACPPEHKELTAHKPVVRLPFPEVVYVPLSQHAGSAAVPLVIPGQEVVRGEPVARAAGFVSVPMHAPATGRVREITAMPTARGALVPSIVIDVYPASSQAVLYGAPRDVDRMSPEELAAAVQETGVVGLGGGAFPTHVKLRGEAGKVVDTIVVNGCECEPYLTTDHRLMLEQSRAILKGLDIVIKAMSVGRAIIGIEANKPDAVEAMKTAAAQDARLDIRVVETRYPLGAEKMLVQLLLGRIVPAGGVPADVGAEVFNVATLAQIGELLPAHQGLIERVITVTGDGIEKPGNYLVPLGTPIRHILASVGMKPGRSRVIFGGPMMGTAIVSWDTPVTKGLSGIVVLSALEDPVERQIHPCIRCGACLEACPVRLNPCTLGQLARVRDYRRMSVEFNVMECFECGCCSYVCPSNIPLAQEFKIARQLVREQRGTA